MFWFAGLLFLQGEPFRNTVVDETVIFLYWGRCDGVEKVIEAPRF